MAQGACLIPSKTESSKFAVFGLNCLFLAVIWPILAICDLFPQIPINPKRGYFWAKIATRKASHKPEPPTSNTSLWPAPVTV